MHPVEPDQVSASSRAFPLRAVTTLAFCGFIAMTSGIMPAGMLTQMADGLNATVTEAGLLTTVHAATMAGTVIPLTRTTLRVPRHLLLLWTMCLLGASTLVVATSPALWIALVGRGMGGVAYGLLWSVVPEVVAQLADTEDQGKAMAGAMSGNSVAMALGAPLGSVLANAIGWRASFGLVGALAITAALLVKWSLPEVPAEAKPRLSLSVAVRMPGVLRTCVGWGLVLVGHMSVLTYIEPFLASRAEPSLSAGTALSLVGVGGVVGVTLAGRTPRLRLVRRSAVATATIIAALVAMAAAPASTPLSVALLLIWGAASTAVALLNQQTVVTTGYRARETATSMSIVLTQTGIALGAMVGGASINVLGLTLLPVVGAAIAGLALTLLIGLERALHAAISDSAEPAYRPAAEAGPGRPLGAAEPPRSRGRE